MNASVLYLHFIFVPSMRYIHSHISHIIGTYKGEMPLANFLKFYFKKNPILGSRDRKIIAEMAYCYYRCVKGLEPKSLSLSEQIDASLLLAESNLNNIVRILPENLQSQYGQSFEENLSFLQQLGIDFIKEHLIYHKIYFSAGIQKDEWLNSMLQRPRLFIRLVPKYKEDVLNLLTEAQVDFKHINDVCLSLANGTAIEKIISEKMYRIQDASSQKTAEYFGIKDNETCWDCCSGAGGKSLLVKDTAPGCKLSASDVRPSILDNLAERFHLYGFAIPERIQLSVANVEESKLILADRKFDHIIADVPCSGSGTWARTPEQLYFFNPETLNDFSNKQRAIADNALNYLKPGGTFIYITCSVFAAENEEIVNDLLFLHPEIRLAHQQIINGLEMGADSMFIAVLKSSN